VPQAFGRLAARRLVPWLAALALAGCSAFEDNGTHLAAALAAGAADLRASQDTERVVRYEPIGGGHESYYVEITPSYRDAAAPDGRPWGSYLVVSGRHAGGTSAHNRDVFVPVRLYIQKAGGATELVLRKDGDHISVVSIR